MVAWDNIDFNLMKEDLVQIEHSDPYDNGVLLFILELLKVYDLKRNEEILSISLELLSWLEVSSLMLVSIFVRNLVQLYHEKHPYSGYFL